MPANPPAVVLVHGGAHAADCWGLTVNELSRCAPEVRVLAVDLPGRGRTAGNLATVTIEDCVNSVVADIEEAGLGDVVVVGHSLAGVTVPAVVAKLGSPRVREMILAAAFIPPQGSAVVDALGGALGLFARWGVAKGRPARFPTTAARLAFCNGMTPQQRRFALSRICSDAPALVTEPVDRSGMPAQVTRTWILTTRDRALSIRQQQRCIRALGGVDLMIPLATCHDLMISEPVRLAAIFAERCKAASAL
jgi:pimeloyl-ACP methyl ester carboxylesterase